MKKYLKIIGVSLVIIGLIFFFAPNKYDKVNIKNGTGGCVTSCFGFSTYNICFGIVIEGACRSDISLLERKIKFWKNEYIKSDRCAKAGESTGSCVGCLHKCCVGTKGLMGYKTEDNKCIKNMSADGFAVRCSDCGNGMCDFEHGENDCNCPEDCTGVENSKDNCGNGLCESEYDEMNKTCVEDCPIPIIANLKGKLSDVKGIQNYYEPFRIKCGNDECCLESFKKAKALRSEIFVWENGKMPIDADCISGYSLKKDDCETSYMWCEKLNKNN